MNHPQCQKRLANCFIESERRRLRRKLSLYERLLQLSRFIPVKPWKVKFRDGVNFRIRLIPAGYQQIGRWRIRIEVPSELKGDCLER